MTERFLTSPAHTGLQHWYNKANTLEDDLKFALLHVDLSGARLNEEANERVRLLINKYRIKHPEMGPNWNHSLESEKKDETETAD